MTTLDNDVRSAAAVSLLSELPAEMRPISAAASDPLEIAAALEARGVSSHVAHDQFGADDVFTLAERLFSTIAPETFERRRGLKRQKPGGPKDLLRGAMFAAPGAMFAAALGAMGLHVPSWTYLLALTTGWAFAQMIAALGSTLTGRNARLGALSLWSLLAAGSVTAGLTALAAVERHSGWTPVGLAAVVTLYMVACSMLLLNDRFRAMALPLLPATAFALMYLLHKPFQVPVTATVAVIASAIGLTIAAALRGVPLRFWRLPVLTRRDFALAGRYFVHGLLCGLATSLIIVLSSDAKARPAVIPVASYPVLITLGVMEWQLYSFRARAQRALRANTSTAQFARNVYRAFLLSLSIYFVALAAGCALVGGYLAWRHTSIPYPLLVAEACLGCVFFVALVMSTCSRMDIVLLSGSCGLIIYTGVCAIRHWRVGSFEPNMARGTCCAAIAISLALLLITSRKSIRSPFSYQ
jgi:hypothetical protein